MDQLDQISKPTLTAALRFMMQVNDVRPVMLSYYDGDYRVQILYENNDINNVIVSRELVGETRQFVDHNLCNMATEFLKNQLQVIREQQARLQMLSGKFNR